MQTSEHIAVIGDGAWATVCALMLCENGHRVRMWSPLPEVAADMQAHRENRKYLPGTPLPAAMEVTGDDKAIFDGVTLVLHTTPTQFARIVWQRLAPHCGADLSVCSVTKGIENGTLMRPTQILLDVLGGPSTRVAALSGPSIAPEVANHLPATVAVASENLSLTRRVQAAITRPYFRVYTNTDLIGTELAGATKNVIAIAAGILDGLRAGDNAKAALLTRGLVEITRLGLAMGAKAETFAGLAGMGDLVTTCISPVGRNRCLGEAIGRGATLKEAQGAAHGVVEGVATTASVVELAASVGVEMPITLAAYDVLFNNRRPADAIADLMARPPKAE